MTGAAKYGTSSRPEVHDLIPQQAVRILDVGCNDGGFGHWLMRGRPDREVWGIEPVAEQANRARSAFNGEVIIGEFPEAMQHIPGDFDCIAFNHVLEHLVDPWAGLDHACKRLAPGGCVIAVIPNVRYFTVLGDLAFRGQWEYRETGLLDRTHLRFFTRRSIPSLFRGSGLRVETLVPVNLVGAVRYPRLSRVTMAVFGDFVVGAFAVRGAREAEPLNGP